MKYDIAIIGASLGGVQAAISAAKAGKTVYMCEETDWIGGQLTSQAVPPDEHKWIEKFGATKRYLDYREKVRSHYRNLPEIAESIRHREAFCPGNSWVSRVAHEPRVALEIMLEELKPYLVSGKLTIDYFTKAIDSVVENDTIISVKVKNHRDDTEKLIEAEYFLDATDCSDLLPITGTEYRTGAEGKDEFNEFHAPEKANYKDIQPITWIAALELNPDGDYKIAKPANYDYYSNIQVTYDDNKLFSWYTPDAFTQKKVRLAMFDNELKEKPLGLWSYRRIIDTSNYTDGRKQVMLLNWSQNDYFLGNIYDTPDAEKNRQEAKELTMALVYWLQNDAPRMDGGRGYAVGLRPDILGTEDGLAKAPYIRESRRIVATHTICEQDVSRRFNEIPRTEKDSVGVGHYAIDIHLTTVTHSFMYDSTYPFEIPLSSMIPIRVKNLIPACKNIGATHLTAGCYRLHPVEWNVGEVAGHLAAFCIDKKLTPKQVCESALEEFQKLISDEGVQLHWNFDEMEL